jgi:beta-phosphoglucomutase family hydrolase
MAVMPTRLGLPASITACLFDLDGVLTRTASLHAAAWKEMFDAFLTARAERTLEPFVPFDATSDYLEYVDGRHRHDGVQAFLRSRGIELPEGAPGDPPDAATLHGLGERKNRIVLAMIHEHGVEPYEGSVRFVLAARDAGLRRAVVSASENCGEVLEALGIDGLFEERVDGLVAAREHLRGKPAPDTYVAAAHRLGVRPRAAAVFEDSLAGIDAGRAGGFGFVVGVDRASRAGALRAHGADIVVSGLEELLALPEPAPGLRDSS